MGNKLLIFIYTISLGSCIGLSLVMCVLVICSWWGGSAGLVSMAFNTYHERIIETIVFPFWTIIGFKAALALLRKKIDTDR